ncbi:LysR family transcriptional regulator [Spongiactinospora rosea]|nr:LysR family transcriptional regulator [Spongiactinospora rosea]
MNASDHAPDLASLRGFLALAQELHFTRTAQQLGISRVRLSQLIRRLESQVGTPLFRRTSRSVTLTAAGHRLCGLITSPYEQLLAGIEEVRTAPSRITGRIRLGLAEPALGEVSGPVLQAIAHEHPGCTIEIHTGPLDNAAETSRSLRDGLVDALLARLPVDDPDLVTGPVLAAEPWSLAVARSHRLAHQPTVSAADLTKLQDRPLLHLPTTHPACRATFSGPFPAPPGPAVRAGKADTAHHRPGRPVAGLRDLRAHVAAGHGIAICVPSLHRHFFGADVVFPTVVDLPATQVALIWHRSGPDERVLALAEAVTEHRLRRREETKKPGEARRTAGQTTPAEAR